MAVKKSKFPGFVIYTYLKDTTYTVVKREAKFLNYNYRFVKGVPVFHCEVCEGGLFLKEILHKKVKDWNSVWNPRK